MATKVTDRIALGIGKQTDQATVLAAVEDATSLISGEATGTSATGIFVNREDVSFGFTRIESDPRMFEDTYRPIGGTFYRVQPTLSFTIDAIGGGQTTTTPEADEFDLTEAMTRILAGAGIDQGTGTVTETPYEVSASGIEYQSMKLWRGSAGGTNDDEAWVFVGCIFDLSWNFTAGEKATLDVTVKADSVIHQGAGAETPVNVTFPGPGSIDYGTQDSTSVPVLRSASANIGGDTRGITGGTISVSNVTQEVGDSNSATGILNEHTGRVIDWSGNWYTDAAAPADIGFDYKTLTSNATDNVDIEFNLGSAAGAGEVANALKFTIPNARFTENTKVEGGLNVIRSLGAYAVTNTDGSESQFKIEGI